MPGAETITGHCRKMLTWTAELMKQYNHWLKIHCKACATRRSEERNTLVWSVSSVYTDYWYCRSVQLSAPFKNSVCEKIVHLIRFVNWDVELYLLLSHYVKLFSHTISFTYVHFSLVWAGQYCFSENSLEHLCSTWVSCLFFPAMRTYIPASGCRDSCRGTLAKIHNALLLVRIALCWTSHALQKVIRRVIQVTWWYYAGLPLNGIATVNPHEEEL